MAIEKDDLQKVKKKIPQRSLLYATGKQSTQMPYLFDGLLRAMKDIEVETETETATATGTETEKARMNVWALSHMSNNEQEQKCLASYLSIRQVQ